MLSRVCVGFALSIGVIGNSINYFLDKDLRHVITVGSIAIVLALVAIATRD